MSKISRICLVTPSSLSANPRLVKEAAALSAKGYEVFVVKGHSYLPYANELDSYVRESWSIAAVVSFGALAPWLERNKQRLRKKLALLFWRLGFRSHALAVRALHPAGPELIAATISVCADLYIAHYPPALPAAALAAQKHGGIYAFDAEDFHLGDPPEHQIYDRLRALTRELEGRWLAGAAFITAASQGIADAYVNSYEIPSPTVVRNMFPLCQAPPGPTPAGSSPQSPSVYWFSQTIGPDRGLECAIQAVALAASRPHLHLRGYVSETYRRSLFSYARQLGVDQQIHLHPPAPPLQMEALAAEFDVGLIGETGCTPNRRIALTNKLFSYVLAGIPALLSDIPAHNAIAAEAGDAVVIYRTNDSQSLARAMDRLLMSAHGDLANARSAAYNLAQSLWNWEVEQVALLRCVEAAEQRIHFLV